MPETSTKKDSSDKEVNKPVTEIQEDLITEQLKMTKANASVWDLLIYSEVHRKALIDALSQIKIPIDTTPEYMVGLVTQKKHGEVTFTDDDLPLEGRDHNKALYIAVEINGKKTSCVMMDDGSAINVCPSKLMPKLGITAEDLKPSELVIRAYDDSKKSVEGTFTIKVKVDPIESTVDIIILDIPITFAILLG